MENLKLPVKEDVKVDFSDMGEASLSRVASLDHYEFLFTYRGQQVIPPKAQQLQRKLRICIAFVAGIGKAWATNTLLNNVSHAARNVSHAAQK